MTKRTLTMLTILLVPLLLGLSGCTTFDNFKEGIIDNIGKTDDSIIIGVYEPMTGADKEAAAPEVQGIELAHKLHPEVAGKRVDLVYADNYSDINIAETAINTLKEKNPTVILGSYGNLYSLIAGESLMGHELNDSKDNKSQNTKPAKIPAITMTNTNPLVTRNNEYYFRICYIDATQGRLLANYLGSINADNIGVLSPTEDDAAFEMATAFTKALNEINDDNDVSKNYEEYTAGEKNFTKYLESLKDKDVKYVLLPGENPDSINIINQAAKAGFDFTFLGDMSWGEEDFHKSLSGQVDPKSLAFVQFFATDGDDQPYIVNETRQQFLDAYKSETGSDQDPEESVALGYDAYMLALDAIEKATDGQEKIASGTAIRDLLLSDEYQYEGASGTIQFNKYGDPKKTAYISTWENDTVVAIYTIEADEQ